MNPPLVSVIIPVFHQADLLQRCLACLQQQTWDAARFEVIVVDNAATPDPQTQAVTSKFGFARCLHAAAPGSYAARNHGIRHACGTVLAFTDADCMPDCAWITTGVTALERAPQIGFVGGRIQLAYTRPGHPTPAEYVDSQTSFQQQRTIVAPGFSVTANMFTWRRVIDNAGAFDTALYSGGDLEWGLRVTQAGYQGCYEPAAVVVHPARRTRAALLRKAARVAGGHCALMRRHKSRAAVLRHLLRHQTLPPLRRIAALVTDRSLPGTRFRVAAVLLIILIRYRSWWETIRLLCGGRERR